MQISFNLNDYEKMKEAVLENGGELADFETDDLLNVGNNRDYFNKLLDAVYSGKYGINIRKVEAVLTEEERKVLCPTVDEYKDFIDNLSIDDIDISDKMDNLDDSGYDTEWDNLSDETQKEFEKGIYEYIKDTLHKDFEGDKTFKDSILTETKRLLVEWESVATTHGSLTGGLYNMDDLYMDALNYVKEEKSKEKEEIDR